MVEEILKHNRPDEEFASQTVNAAVQKARDAFEQRNDPEKAKRVIELCSKALGLLRGELDNLDCQRLQGDILRCQGYTWLHPLKQPRQALRAFGQSLQLARDAGDETSEIDALMGMADALIQLGEAAKAAGDLQQALEQARAICDKKREGAIRYRQIRIKARELSDAKHVYELLRSVESIATEIGDPAHANVALVEAHFEQHGFEEDWIPSVLEKPQAAMQALLDVIDLIPESFPKEADPNSPFGFGYFDIKLKASEIRLGYCPEAAYTGHAKESDFRMWSDGVFRHLFATGTRNLLSLPAMPVDPGPYSEDEDEKENYRRQMMVESIDESLQGVIFRFPRCIKLKVIISTREPEDEEWATAWIWFARGIGLAKIYYEYSNGETTEIDLIDYRLTELSDDYFPLSPDNMWVYRWSKSDGNYMLTEKWRVFSAVDEPDYGDCAAFRLTHGRYHLYMPEIPDRRGMEWNCGYS